MAVVCPQNPFYRNFRAKFVDDEGDSFSCSYNLQHRAAKAHFVVAIQTSRSQACVQAAAEKVATIYNSMSPDDDMILITFDSQMRVHSNIYTDIYTLDEVLRLVVKTDGELASLWDTFTHACSMFLDWQHEFQHHNCFLYIAAAGHDTCNGDMSKSQATYKRAKGSIPFLSCLASVPAGTPLRDNFFSGENVVLAEHIKEPGAFYVGSAHFVAKGTNHPPSDLQIAARDRTPEGVAARMTSLVPYVAEQLGAVSLLPGLYMKLGITGK